MGYEKGGGPYEPHIDRQGRMHVKVCPARNTFSCSYGDAQTGLTIITPHPYERARIVQVFAANKSDIDLRVYFDNGSGEDSIFELFPIKRTSELGPVINLKGGLGQAVKLDCGADTFVQIAYDILDH